MKVKEAVTRAVAKISAQQARLLKRTACRAVLDYARIRQQTVSYLDLAEVLSAFSGGSELAGLLGEVAEEDWNSGSTLVLPALVVRKDTGRPGKGFFTFMAAMGAQYIHFDGGIMKALPLIDIIGKVPDPAMDDRCIDFWADMVCELLGPNVAVKTTADKSHSQIVFTGPRKVVTEAVIEDI